MDTPYTEDYYVRGKESGLSLYSDYRWLPDLTIPMAHWLVCHLGIQRCDTILDFGCARGYVVKALRLLGYSAFGVDCSEWAIANADDGARPYIRLDSGIPTFAEYDWLIAKDVLEHIPGEDLVEVLSALGNQVKRGFLIAVPLSHAVGEGYVINQYERDITHVQRLTLEEWGRLVADCVGDSFTVSWTYRLPGLKDNYAHIARGNGFIVGRRHA